MPLSIEHKFRHGAFPETHSAVCKSPRAAAIMFQCNIFSIIFAVEDVICGAFDLIGRALHEVSCTTYIPGENWGAGGSFR